MDKFANYRKWFHALGGWFDPAVVSTIGAIDDYQRAAQIFGPLAEIGVFCGKSFLPLAICARDDEYAVAVDPFELGTTIDRFDANCQLVLTPEQRQRVTVHQKSSSDITAGDLVKDETDCQVFRVFSVDGDHRYESTLGDLTTAIGFLDQRGIIMLDDVWNRDHPGVSEALHDFIDNHKEIVPFCFSKQRTFLSRSASAEDYRNALWRADRPRKSLQFHGEKVLVY